MAGDGCDIVNYTSYIAASNLSAHKGALLRTYLFIYGSQHIKMNKRFFRVATLYFAHKRCVTQRKHVRQLDISYSRTGRCVCAAVLGNLTHLCHWHCTGTAQCSLLIFIVLTIVYWTLHYTLQMLPPHLTIKIYKSRN